MSTHTIITYSYTLTASVLHESCKVEYIALRGMMTKKAED